MSSKKKILIVEPLPFAHSVGYFRAILQSAKLSEEYEVQFVYGEPSEENKEILEPLRREFGSSFQAQEVGLSGKAMETSQLGNLTRAWQVLKEVRKVCREFKPDNVAYLYSDFVVRLLGIPGAPFIIGKKKGEMKVSGVFFNSRCFREKGRKNWLIANLVRRGMSAGYFDRLLFLDHGVIDVASQGVSEQKAPQIRRAVDPWSSPPGLGERKTEDPKMTLLCFGAHSERKGTLQIVKLFAKFPDQLVGFRLLIAGPVRDDIREEFYELVQVIEKGEAEIEVKDRYFEDQESWGLFHQSHAVLCPYVDFHGSSNVIIRSAAYGLPVIGPAFGFVGELIEENKIGAIYHGMKIEAILEAILKVGSNLQNDPKFYQKDCKAYADFHHERNYLPSLI